MPMITIKAIENVFDKKQKKELIAKFTDAVEDVYPGIRDVTFVIIEEVKESDWGIGGHVDGPQFRRGACQEKQLIAKRIDTMM